MSTKRKLRDHGFVYQDVAGLRVTATVTNAITGKGVVEVREDGTVVDSKETRSPASVFDAWVQNFQEGQNA